MAGEPQRAAHRAVHGDENMVHGGDDMAFCLAPGHEAAASGAGVSDAATSSLFLLAAAALVVVSSEASAAAVELSADVDASDPGQLQTGEEAGIHEYNKIKKSMF